MAEPKERKKSAACPVCGRPVEAASQPFCSERCKMVDLNRWLSGVYRVSGQAPGKTDSDEPSN